MIITCVKCGAEFEDVYRTTVCPHDTFPANDGNNNFAHHPESHYKPKTEGPPDRPPRP